MDKIKALYYLENSFLSSLFAQEEVTDVTYNGRDIYYVSNEKGRMKSDIVVDLQIVKDFLRQIANITEQQFSFTNPVLDVSVGKYRINATHQSVAKSDNDDVVNFAIRIASETPRIDSNSDFFAPTLVELIKVIANSHQSIVIGGITSTGKTEFQKFIIRNFKRNERVIVVDNVLELDSLRHEADIDLSCWKVDEKNQNVTSALLIKNALRNNPDWLIVAEARDKEMVDVLNSAMTGLPLITTIHAYDGYSMPFRMARLVLRGDQKLDYGETLQDIYYHFHFHFYLKKKVIKDHIVRYIASVGYFDNDGQYFQIYKKSRGKHIYSFIPKSGLDLLELDDVSNDFKNCFIGEKQYE